MILELQLRVTPEQAADFEYIRKKTIKKLGLSDFAEVKIRKRSIDARQKVVMIQLSIVAYENESAPELTNNWEDLPSVENKEEVFIIGCGPAGLFSAIQLIKNGKRPIIIERGKDVRSRRRDLAAINKEHKVNPDSNYCFGEGGAGTYSDGKLYTRSGKRGDINEVLRTFVAFGASPDILIDAHPHIGTNKLPAIITAMREFIESKGGMALFETKLTGLVIDNNAVSGIEINGNETIKCSTVILATGHSARDIYFMLYANNILLEQKPFALGVRMEHPQAIIDSIQYHCESRGEYLPPASYSLTEQVNGRGVYSFCMCPGGIIAPCSTASEEVVTNGWSPSKRNNPFANSGFVVTIDSSDLDAYKEFGPLAGLVFQIEAERKAWIAGGRTQSAPAQRLTDFIAKKSTAVIPATSYQPGVTSVNLHDVLPSIINTHIHGALLQLKKHKPAYYTEEAVLVAIESRTSSPVRIPRDSISLQHPVVSGMYPCGEGAGFAGGIVSAAMDGIKIADKIAQIAKN